jgi:1,2-dihydroxy-3-keto-5-methylthiopentene dioxygenase
MKAYRLDNPVQTVGSDDLARRGILSWTVPPNESDRAAMIDRALIERIKREHGYVDEDFVELAPETPNLETICAKFDKEHFHTEDEVRAVVEGAGIFDVRDEGDQWIRIEVSKGDMIVIPARTFHRFYLTDAKHIRCMRLFANNEGWAPLYREA